MPCICTAYAAIAKRKKNAESYFQAARTLSGSLKTILRTHFKPPYPPIIKPPVLKKTIFLDIQLDMIDDITEETAFYDETQMANQSISAACLVPLKADMETFRFYNQLFAKDRQHCFLQQTMPKEADLHTFAS